MTPRTRHLLLSMLAVALVVGYITLLHQATARDTPSVLGALLALLPMGLTALWLAWISAYRPLAVGAWLAAAGLLAYHRGLLADHFAYVELVQHAGTFACLTALFGRTLVAGRTPMVSVFARTVHGSLPAELARYTRRLTAVWTTVFAVMSLSSLVLFFSGHVAQWSLLANVLTPLIIAAVFLIEYRIRCRCLPAHMRSTLIASMRAAWPGFDRWMAQRGPETPERSR